MFALLAHATSLLQSAPRLLPLLTAPAAALAVGVALRLLPWARRPRGATIAAALAILAGNLALRLPWAAWPPPPSGRLPGAAMILLAGTLLGARPGAGLATAVAAAWWLRGAPATANAILNTMPAFLGLAAALPAARRLAARAPGWASTAAALALAAGLFTTGAPSPYPRAALAAAGAALALSGMAEAAPVLAGATMLIAAAAIIATAAGRITAIDLACLAPLIVWPLARLWPHRPPAKPARRRTTRAKS